MSKSTGSAILLFLACIAIAIFYIIAIVSSNTNENDGSVVGQQDTFSSGNNLRQLSLIDPKTVETRQGSGLRSSGVSFNDQLEQVSRDFRFSLGPYFYHQRLTSLSLVCHSRSLFYTLLYRCV